MKCKNCKWWADKDDFGDEFVFLPGKYDHTCTNVIVSDAYSIYRPAGLASYEPIGFGPDFGCIHFEAA